MDSQSFQLPDLSSEFSFRTSRSSGPGGQHVNKVNSRVELRFNIPASRLLTNEQKSILIVKLSPKITTNGDILVVSQKARSQLLNKTEASLKFYELLKKALRPIKKRRATRPSRASIEKRIRYKKQQSDKKRLRGKID